MQQVYKFKWRRRIVWNKEKVIGHHYDSAQNKMVVYYPDGAVKEIAKWSSCEVALGADWVLSTKKRLEEQSGHPLTLSVKE